MNLMKRSLLALAIAGTFAAGAAQAQISNNVIKIGVLSDMSSLYTDLAGAGSVVAAKMAVEDSGIEKRGIKVEIVSADHQNKPDVGSAIARRWYDTENVDAITDVPNSGVALAVAGVTKEKNKVFLASGPGSSDLTGKSCSPNTVHFTYDTWMLAHGTGSAIVKTGGKTWFFLTADYAFGKALEKNTADVVKANGGQVLGEVRHPLSASDFSSFLLQAQASKAQVLGLANAGGDTINAIKAAKEFGITKTMKLAALLMFINDVHSLGLETTQGLVLTDSWYWNKDANTRKWSQRYFDKMKKMPSSLQAADYSATMTYLKAVQAVGSTDSDKVMAQLKKTKIDDFYAKGYIRQDGSMIHDMYLMQVKTPAESKEPWDYYKITATIPGEQAFTTKAESRCALWK